MAEAEHQERSNGEDGSRRSHILVVAYSIQGHLNPARSLARRLAGVDGTTVTLSIPLFGHRRMFPESGDEEVDDGLISYIPYSDGKDDNSHPRNADDMKRSWRSCFESLSAVVAGLAAAGRPVARMMCTLNMTPVVDVARAHGIPLAFYWIQAATALVAYYHYFHGLEEAITADAVADPAYAAGLPGLRWPIGLRDMPSFFADKVTGNDREFSAAMVLNEFRQLFEHVDREKSAVLVNTFAALEDAALEAIRPYIDVFAVGPTVPPVGEEGAGEAPIHLFRQDEEKKYMRWLDARPARSVVYVSSGSLLTYNKRQVEELLLGLRRCARPYLCVVRKEGRTEEVDRLLSAAEAAGVGMVVEWCDQLRVLAHPSVACFVSHCGWNSTLEAVAAGVPMVAAPRWSDQPVNAHLVEEEWGVGVRAERDDDGVLLGEELARCVEMVTGDDAKGVDIRANVSAFKERAQEAIAADGPLDRSLRSFVNTRIG